MSLQEVRSQVLVDVRRHCEARGFHEGPGVNNFVPHDCVAAFAMARLLTAADLFDHYLAAAPEGHIYGYFFECLGKKVLSVHADYPPTRCESANDLSVLRDSRVLVLEDDVIGGGTLRLVAAHLQRFCPRSLALYLGHTKGIQHLRNVPSEFKPVYLAEDHLDWAHRQTDEEAFVEFFRRTVKTSPQDQTGGQ
jgi:hypothetical protein